MKIATILIPIFAIGCGSAKEVSTPAPSQTSLAELTKTIDPMLAKDYVGVIAPTRSAVVVAKVDARVEEVFVRMGTWIDEGAPIAKLDDESLQPLAISAKGGVDAARAAYRGASITVADARRRLKVERNLFRQGVTAQASVSTAQAEVSRASAGASQALAGLKSAEAEADRINQLVRDATLRAPMSGLVSVIRTSQGQVVANGQTIVRIVDPKEVKVRFAIPGDEAAKLKVGSRVVFQTPTNKYTATVREVAPELEPPLQLIVAEADLMLGSAPLPRPGLVGTVSLVGG